MSLELVKHKDWIKKSEKKHPVLKEKTLKDIQKAWKDLLLNTA